MVALRLRAQQQPASRIMTSTRNPAMPPISSALWSLNQDPSTESDEDESEPEIEVAAALDALFQ
jgi:hypothetical protein